MKTFLKCFSTGLVAGAVSGIMSAAAVFRLITGDSLLAEILSDFACDGDCEDCGYCDPDGSFED